MEGSFSAFSKELFPFLASWEPPQKEALDWIQFAFTGDAKGQYAAPANSAFYLVSPVEGGPQFLPVTERLQTLYPGPTPGVLHLQQSVQTILILKQILRLIWM